MQISQLRQSWEIVERGRQRGSEGVWEGRGKEGFTPAGREKGRTERAYREAESSREQPQAADTGNMQHECMRGALGNDIGIMAEHGTNEMTNGPTDWNRGLEIRAPSKEGHGVIIQANKGRSHQDYRFLALRPTPSPLALSLSASASASPLFVRNYRAKLLSVASPSISWASPVPRDATR